MSAICAYYISPQYFIGGIDSQLNTKEASDLIWIRQYQKQLDDEKANDPKTVFGWALKGLIK